MQTKHEILLLPEVAERLRVSTATVNRLLSQRRKGEGGFPLPISQFKGRGRWLANDVDGYIESLSNCNGTVPVKSQKQKAREFIERQKRAQHALEQHGIKKCVANTQQREESES
jgi:predicted DNA-binding transcriptional regulator AlpA